MFSCRRRVARSYLLGHRELAFVVVVPGGGDFDDIVAAGEGGHIDGAAARLGVGDDGVPPVVVDRYIVSDIGVVNNVDYIQFTVVIDIGHVGRNVHLGVRKTAFNINMNICRISVNVSKCHNWHHT